MRRLPPFIGEKLQIKTEMGLSISMTPERELTMKRHSVEECSGGYGSVEIHSMYGTVSGSEHASWVMGMSRHRFTNEPATLTGELAMMGKPMPVMGQRTSENP